MKLTGGLIPAINRLAAPACRTGRLALCGLTHKGLRIIKFTGLGQRKINPSAFGKLNRPRIERRRRIIKTLLNHR